jgi:hypothetical protein
MADFRILNEVRHRPANSEGWEICFQFGVYTYGPEPGNSEPGYRFIWRRPDGTLQAARGQARLTPEYIAILLGLSAQAGWYPVPQEEAAGVR